MAKLTVEVVTPEKRLLATQVDEAIVPGTVGLFGVLPGHTAFLSLLDAGPLTLKDGGTVTQYFVAGGFAEVANDQVLILADQAEPVTNIDVEAASTRLRAAQEKLKGMTPKEGGRDALLMAVRRETARIALGRAGKA